jgi:hypothetical protein
LAGLGQAIRLGLQEVGEVALIFGQLFRIFGLPFCLDRLAIPVLRRLWLAGIPIDVGQLVPGFSGPDEVASFFMNSCRLPVVLLGLIPLTGFLEGHAKLMPDDCFRRRLAELLK